MRTLDLDALQIFKAVADHGGVTKAAAQLHRVQSNVTTRVKQLEERLGTRLFLRHSRKLVLSPEGELLLAYANRLLRLSSEAEAAVRSGAPRGTLRIGALESTSATRLPPILARFHSTYPEVQIELTTGTTGALISKVLKYDVEAAFVAEPFTAYGLESQPAFSEELVLIAPKSSPSFKSAKDLAHATLIAFSTGCSYRRRLEEWLSLADVAPDRVMEFGSYHAIVACVAAGSGVAFVPRSVVRVLHAEGDVSCTPLPSRIAKTRTHLAWREGHRSIALDALRRELSREKR